MTVTREHSGYGVEEIPAVKLWKKDGRRFNESRSQGDETSPQVTRRSLTSPQVFDPPRIHRTSDGIIKLIDQCESSRVIGASSKSSDVLAWILFPEDSDKRPSMSLPLGIILGPYGCFSFHSSPVLRFPTSTTAAASDVRD
ncbi:hypothetical protein KQX54_010877 [Cotesia glomerata]|uniref:Uncharacterized protein n=1 Tax=Cotesia glomerata TaxID=32391 RepID=A0AAV7J4E2_COTGL|nr:hypothetical protein KQX54_010877 [Cotesia glomerata]